MSANLFKAGGWSVVYHPVSGQLYIYRLGTPGEMTLEATDTGYEFNAYADSETFVTGTFASFEALTSKEPA